MRGRPRRKPGRSARSSDAAAAAPRLRRPVSEAGGPFRPGCATALAMESLRTGVLPAQARRRRSEIPREDATLQVGDPDDSGLLNEYVGEETPGGSTPTPDQNGVDEIGRAYGLQEEDSGALRSAAEVLGRRDRRRSELQPPSRAGR